MAKKHTLPVAKAGGPQSVSNSIDGPDKISVEERRYRAEDGMRTLAKAEEIRKNKELMKDIKSHAKAIQKAICK